MATSSTKMEETLVTNVSPLQWSSWLWRQENIFTLLLKHQIMPTVNKSTGFLSCEPAGLFPVILLWRTFGLISTCSRVLQVFSCLLNNHSELKSTESGDVYRDNSKKKAKIGRWRECVLGSSWDLSLIPVAKLCRLSLKRGSYKRRSYEL